MTDNTPAPAKKVHESGSVTFGVMLLAVGVLSLLWNFGFLSGALVNYLWKFWPVVLIFFGIESLLSRSALGRFLMLVLGVGAMLLLLGYAATISGFLKL